LRGGRRRSRCTLGASVSAGDSGAGMSASQQIAAPMVLYFARITAMWGNIGNIFFGPAFLVTAEVRNMETSPHAR
jgi:hypothetical protein